MQLVSTCNVEWYSCALCKPLHKLDKCFPMVFPAGSDAGVTVKVPLNLEAARQLPIWLLHVDT